MHPDSFKRLLRQSLRLTWASLKSRYRKTIAGFLWVLLNPLIMFGVQSLVFKKFLRLDVPNYYVFLLSGLLPWIFLTQTIQMATPTLVGHSSLLKAFKFHPAVIVVSMALDNFLNFVLTTLLVAVPAMLLSDAPLMGLLFLPACLVPFIVGTLALALIFSLMHVFFRDTSFVLSFLISIFFFITPIFYPVEFIPEQYRWMVDWNVFYQLIHPIRLALYDGPSMDWLHAWLRACGWALGMSLLCFMFWKKKRNGIYIQL